MSSLPPDGTAAITTPSSVSLESPPVSTRTQDTVAVINRRLLTTATIHGSASADGMIGR